MSVRRALFWIAANVSLAIVVALTVIAWLIFVGPHEDLAGPSATGRSLVIPTGLLLLLVAGVVVAMNAAWAVVVVVRRRRARAGV